MNLPLLQSHAWEKLQADLGEETIFEETDDYTFLGIVKHSRFGNYLYLPYGPYLRNKNAANACFKALQSLSEAKNLIFARIEPQSPENAEFLLSQPNCLKTKDLNPADTWVLDLSAKKSTETSKNPSETDEKFEKNTENSPETALIALKQKLPSRLIRYYKNREKNGLKIETSKNLDDTKYLVDLQSKLAKTKKISIFSEKYLKTELKQPFATLYLVKYHQVNNPSEVTPEKTSENSTETELEDRVIAAGLVFDDEKTRYNLQGAQDEDFRRTHATGILTIQLILDAKAKGLEKFDFWGIAPDDAPESHPWAGFTAFKKSFDGKPVSYAGTHDLIFDRKKYRLYKIARKANRTFRKILH